jgi:uncharacterized protein (DUF302 family)
MRHILVGTLIASSLLAGPALAQQKTAAKAALPKIEAGLAIRASKLTVKETIDSIAKAAEEKGAKVVARVDHAAGAKAVGVDMKPSQLLIFGNPKLGTPLMQTNARVGLALPLKVLAYEDAAGKVWVVNETPASTAAKFKLNAKAEQDAAKAATGAIDAIMTAAAIAP